MGSKLGSKINDNSYFAATWGTFIIKNRKHRNQRDEYG